jgi:dihydrofolate reductase
MIVAVAAPAEVPYAATGAVIGIDGQLPWCHPGDQARFKRVTLGSTVIMGRKTWESVRKPLPSRRNVVVSRSDVAGVETFRDVGAAIAAVDPAQDLWLIGGSRIYEDGMRYVDFIDVTYVPERVSAADAKRAARFPDIDPGTWVEGPLVVHEDEPALQRRVYTRR